MKMIDPITITKVEGCSRCGLDHDAVEAGKLTRPHAPPEAAPTAWTHWFLCPRLLEPVLVSLIGDVPAHPVAVPSTLRTWLDAEIAGLERADELAARDGGIFAGGERLRALRDVREKLP